MSNDNAQAVRDEIHHGTAVRHGDSQVREGVLAVPGELKLHFGGTLESVSIAWRLAGPAGAPVVVALGGISASRRVWLPDERARRLVARSGRARPRARYAAVPRS